jgi:lysophospholipase L1-like esterase
MPTITAMGDSRVHGVTPGASWVFNLMSRFGHDHLTSSKFLPWTGADENQRLDGNGYTFYDAGIPSQQTDQMRARWNTDVLGHTSDYIICGDYGVNDVGLGGRAAADIIADSEWMQDSARANARVKTFITTIMPWTGATSAQRDVIDAVNVARRAYAAAHPSDTVLVDLFAAFEATPGSRTLNPAYSDDGLHLNAAGELVCANLFTLADFGYTAPPAPDTSIRIAAGPDDVLKRLTTAAFTATGTTQYLGNTSETAKQYGNSLRFTGIPTGRRALQARLLLTSLNDFAATTVAARVSAWAHDNSPTITTTGGFDTAFAARTTATVDCPNVGPWGKDFAYAFDITAPFNEVVSRAGFGGAFTAFVDDFDNRSSTAAVRQFYSYNSSALKAAVLEVWWMSPSGPAFVSIPGIGIRSL